MTGRLWRVLALVLLGVFVVRIWWVANNWVELVLALAATAASVVLLALRVEEKPHCEVELPVEMPRFSTHAVHHCHLEKGHARDLPHECRCGLVAFPPKAASGAGSLQVVLDSVGGVA